jgi:hypothetical protein
MNTKPDTGALIAGGLFIVAGLAFLLEAFDVFSLTPGVVWPAVVIGFGLAIAFGGRRTPPEGPPPTSGNHF